MAKLTNLYRASVADISCCEMCSRLRAVLCCSLAAGVVFWGNVAPGVSVWIWLFTFDGCIWRDDNRGPLYVQKLGIYVWFDPDTRVMETVE